MNDMKVSVIGLGYIGLPTAMMLATHGVEVVGVDYNHELVSTLNHGHVTFNEQGLEDLYRKARSCNIAFSCEYVDADIYIVAVPTPYDKHTKKIDATFVVKAVKCVLTACHKGSIICIESTISPGTIDRFVRPVVEEAGLKIGEDIHLVHTPERIIPGNMIYELEHNSRTIGADNPEIGEIIKKVYSSFCQGEIVVTDIRTAEMTKVVENTYRDINIAYANELAKICRQEGMDVYEIIRIANKHPRVNILSPGPGVGGHCISVDPWFLVGDYPNLANLIKQARLVNDSMPEYVLGRIADIMEENGIEDVRRVGLYGLTYKENVDDVRESPTLQLLECMKKHLARGIKVYDPCVSRDIVENQYHDFDRFADDVDMVVIMVGHSDLETHIDRLANKVILDTRHVCKDLNVYRL